jgi:hypothetical protein
MPVDWALRARSPSAPAQSAACSDGALTTCPTPSPVNRDHRPSHRRPMPTPSTAGRPPGSNSRPSPLASTVRPTRSTSTPSTPANSARPCSATSTPPAGSASNPPRRPPPVAHGPDHPPRRRSATTPPRSAPGREPTVTRVRPRPDPRRSPPGLPSSPAREPPHRVSRHFVTSPAAVERTRGPTLPSDTTGNRRKPQTHRSTDGFRPPGDPSAAAPRTRALGTRGRGPGLLDSTGRAITTAMATPIHRVCSARTCSGGGPRDPATEGRSVHPLAPVYRPCSSNGLGNPQVGKDEAKLGDFQDLRA